MSEAKQMEGTQAQRVEAKLRERLANNGRNPANNNAGIRVGSDLHLCEILLGELARLRALNAEMLVEWEKIIELDHYPDAIIARAIVAKVKQLAAD